MDRSPTLETFMRRDRWIVGASLALLVLICWVYLAVLGDAMTAMTGQGGSMAFMWLMPMGRWGATDFVLGCVMWVVMMIGMMVPSAAPMILLYALIRRRERDKGRVLPPTGVFVAGYLVAWSGFSLAATLLQYAFTEARVMSDFMKSESVALGAAILILAGIYQLTPWKSACLMRCRSPLAFFINHWRPGVVGSFRMGLSHGAYCVGCCWAVMCVLFVVGVMNLVWIAVLSALVLLEKAAPRGQAIARASGVLLIGAGTVVLVQAF